MAANDSELPARQSADASSRMADSCNANGNSGQGGSLLGNPLGVVARETFDPFENRFRIEMGFLDHFFFQSPGEPLIVPVRGQRIGVGQRPQTLYRPDPPCRGA